MIKCDEEIVEIQGNKTTVLSEISLVLITLLDKKVCTYEDICAVFTATLKFSSKN